MTAAPVPSLAEHLDRKDRGEGFEEFVAEVAAAALTDLEPGQRATLRVMKPLAIAFVEALRGEIAAGRDGVETTDLVCIIAGYTLFLAVVSGLKEGAPLDRVAEIVVDAAAHGIRRAAADQGRKR